MAPTPAESLGASDKATSPGTESTRGMPVTKGQCWHLQLSSTVPGRGREWERERDIETEIEQLRATDAWSFYFYFS